MVMPLLAALALLQGEAGVRTWPLPEPAGAKLEVVLHGHPLMPGRSGIGARIMAPGAPEEDFEKATVEFRVARKRDSSDSWTPMKGDGDGEFEAEHEFASGTSFVQFRVLFPPSTQPREFLDWEVRATRPSDPRSILIAGMLVLPGLGLLNFFYGMIRLKGLLRKLPQIATPAHLEVYKAEIRVQMFLAVFQWAVLSIPSLLFALDLFVYNGEIGDLVYAIGPSIVLLVIGKTCGGAEQAVREIPVTGGDDLQREKGAILSTWGGRAFPDF